MQIAVVKRRNMNIAIKLKPSIWHYYKLILCLSHMILITDVGLSLVLLHRVMMWNLSSIKLGTALTSNIDEDRKLNRSDMLLFLDNDNDHKSSHSRSQVYSFGSLNNSELTQCSRFISGTVRTHLLFFSPSTSLTLLHFSPLLPFSSCETFLVWLLSVV